ncbi:hypothetical protein J6590_022576 [Homalodisca vitripennis]|nr:hypothetical protein J6590_022576 [Homalodisca vitripennis]
MGLNGPAYLYLGLDTSLVSMISVVTSLITPVRSTHGTSLSVTDTSWRRYGCKLGTIHSPLALRELRATRLLSAEFGERPRPRLAWVRRWWGDRPLPSPPATPTAQTATDAQHPPVVRAAAGVPAWRHRPHNVVAPDQ